MSQIRDWKNTFLYVKERYDYAINMLLKEGLDDIIFEALL